MLEKTPGAVVCGHCHGPDADTICPYCRQAVCKRCLDSERCPEPHPWDQRLGLGRRLLAIDESGRYGVVGHIFGGATGVRELRSGAGIEGLLGAHEGLPVEYPDEPGVNGGVIVRVAWSYRTTEIGPDQVQVDRVSPLLLVGRVEGDRVSELRFVPRPARHVSMRALVTADGRTAALVSASHVDIVELDDQRPARVVDPRGQMIHCAAVSETADLLAVGIFGEVLLYRLSTGARAGGVPLEGENVTAVALGGQRLAAVTEGRQLHILHRRAGHADKDEWETIHTSELVYRGALTDLETSLSHDGKLFAARHKRKRVLVLDLDGGATQRLDGHTDRVNLVRFIAGGRLLVTADKDNRVCYWPRSEQRIIASTGSSPT
jgi:hypothetical protein